MISTSHLHRRSSSFVAFIAILRGSPFETCQWSKIRDFRQYSVLRKTILIHRKFLNKRAGASEFILESTAATTQLIRDMNKFDGTDFVSSQRTHRAVANLVR